MKNGIKFVSICRGIRDSLVYDFVIKSENYIVFLNFHLDINAEFHNR